MHCMFSHRLNSHVVLYSAKYVSVPYDADVLEKLDKQIFKKISLYLYKYEWENI